MNAQKKAKAGRPPKSPEMKQHQRSIRLTASEWALVEAGAAELRRSQAWIVSECVRASLSTVIAQDRAALSQYLRPEGVAQVAAKSTAGGMDASFGVLPKAIQNAIENLAGGEHPECVQELFGLLRPYFAENAERGLAHEWIRPTLGLDDSAPYRFDFYAQEIDKLKARQDARNKLPQLNDDLIAILGRPNFACAGIAKILRAGGMSIAHRSENEQAAVIHFLLGHYLSDPIGWADSVSAAFDTILASSAQQEDQP